MVNKKTKRKPKSTFQRVPVKKTPDTVKINKQQLFILFCLLIAVFIAYLPSLNKEFINFDDDNYITLNPYIANFSLTNIPTIFSHFYQAQYSPVPTVIYGIINMIAGFNPFIFNLIAVLLHLVTMMLAFKLIWSLCNNFRIAFATAALFGIATLQVESVAWLAAVYKTCTYSILFLSSLIVYVRYIKTNKIKHYIFSLLIFFISCFCKEQAVSMSLAVVAIDIYFGRRLFSKKVILEKVPFFLISVAFGILTIAATKSNKELINITSFSIIERIIYASYAFCVYIFKLFVPIKLSIYYPYFPLTNSGILYGIFPLLFLIITGLYVWAIKKKNKYIIFGGLFFLLNILFSLALQVIEVRPTVLADRYVYLASIGIFFIVAVGANILIEKKIIRFRMLVALFGVFFLITAYLTYSRTKVWKNSLTVADDVIDKYSVPLMWANRGFYYLKQAEIMKDESQKMILYDKALSDYNNAIIKDSSFDRAFRDRGTLHFYKGSIYLSRNESSLAKCEDSLALLDYNKVISLNPKHAITYSNRGAVLTRNGKYELALKDLDMALNLNPENDNAYANRSLALEMLGRYDEAISDHYRFLKLKPNSASVYNSIGVDKQHLKKFKESIEDFNKAISLESNGTYYWCRSYSWNALGDKVKALADVQRAIKMGVKVDQNYLNILQK